MIKIIRRGKVRVVTCTECGTVFSYEQTDVRSRETSIDDSYYYVVCPICGTEVPQIKEGNV